MLRQITWQTYFIAFAIVTIFYCLVILFLFYKKDWQQLLRRRGKNKSTKAEEDITLPGDIDLISNSYAAYQSVRDEVHAFLESDDSNHLKSDALLSLAAIINKYPVLKDTWYSEAVNRDIRLAYLKRNTDTISDEELAALWQS